MRTAKKKNPLNKRNVNSSLSLYSKKKKSSFPSSLSFDMMAKAEKRRNQKEKK
jgi:hypothetical protein